MYRSAATYRTRTRDTNTLGLARGRRLHRHRDHITHKVKTGLRPKGPFRYEVRGRRSTPRQTGIGIATFARRRSRENLNSSVHSRAVFVRGLVAGGWTVAFK